MPRAYYFTAVIGLIIGAYVLTKHLGVDLFKSPDDPVPVTEITLIGADGQDTTLGRFGEKWLAIFLGFASCPDICPTALAALETDLVAASIIPRDQVQVVFVSLDPERDRPDYVDEYAKAFHPTFVGMTGTSPALQRLARSLGTTFSISKVDGPMGYLVNHAPQVYLVDPQGRLVEAFDIPFTKGSLAARLGQLATPRKAIF